MIEMIATTIMMAFIVIAVVTASMAIDALRTQTRDSVYLSVHNLNCMERLRRECLDSNGELLLFYSDDFMGSDTIETEAYLERTFWDKFNIYSVRIESTVRETNQHLTSIYVITDIGGVKLEEEINPEYS